MGESGEFGVAAAAASWWRMQAHRAGLHGRWAEVDEAVGPAPTSSNRPRSSRFASATSAPVAAAMWDRALDAGACADGGVLDPAAGVGRRLHAPLRALLQTPDGLARLEAGPGLIAGFDPDPLVAWFGSVLLAADLLPAIRKDVGTKLPQLIRSSASQDETWRPAGTVLLSLATCPPFDAPEHLADAAGAANADGLVVAHIPDGHVIRANVPQLRWPCPDGLALLSLTAGPPARRPCGFIAVWRVGGPSHGQDAAVPAPRRESAPADLSSSRLRRLALGGALPGWPAVSPVAA